MYLRGGRRLDRRTSLRDFPDWPRSRSDKARTLDTRCSDTHWHRTLVQPVDEVLKAGWALLKETSDEIKIDHSPIRCQ